MDYPQSDGTQIGININMPNYMVFSVDFEFFSDTFAFQKLKRRWTYAENGETGVEMLLDLFHKYKIRSTFFIVAKYAQSHKELIRKIIDNGHEIASHSVTHVPFLNRPISEIQMEIRDSKKTLEEVTGKPIIGFRSPACRIDSSIMETIGQNNYKYDSSVVPCWSIPGWYGRPDAPRYPFSVKKMFPDINSGLIEFPIAANPVTRTPISGAWMRLFGTNYTLWSIKALLRRKAFPIMYVHPWEVVNLPRLEGIPWRVYYRTGAQTLSAIEHIIGNTDAKFVTIRDLLEKEVSGKLDSNK